MTLSPAGVKPFVNVRSYSYPTRPVMTEPFTRPLPANTHDEALLTTKFSLSATPSLMTPISAFSGRFWSRQRIVSGSTVGFL